MKLLIPIEIKSVKDLPEKEGIYYIQTKDFIVKGNIDQDYFNPKNNLKKINWLKFVKLWYKEVSENEYKKKILREHEFKCPACGEELTYGLSDETIELIKKSKFFRK